MRVTTLGSGSVKGAPVYGCNCKVCNRARHYKEFNRAPSSALIEAGDFRLLLDAGLTDLCERFPAGEISHILLTHYHMDHVQGLFNLRWGEGISIHVLGPDDPVGCDDLHKHTGVLDFSRKTYPFETFELGPLRITPLPMNHSRLTLGYFIEHGNKRIAYLTDTCGLKEEVSTFIRKRRSDLAIIDCSMPPQQVPPNNHNDLTQALEIHHSINPKRTWLTHIGHTMDAWLDDHATELPKKVIASKDGMSLTL